MGDDVKKDTAYYAIATIFHSLITKEKMKKTEAKNEVNRILDEMYKEFSK